MTTETQDQTQDLTADTCCGGTECQSTEATGTATTETAKNVVLVRPAVDIVTTESDVWLTADVPGASADSVDITVERNLLTVEAATTPVDAVDCREHYREFPTRLFKRTFRLSTEVDRTGIEANVAHGVLTLRLPKVAEAQPQKVAVTAG